MPDHPSVEESSERLRKVAEGGSPEEAWRLAAERDAALRERGLPTRSATSAAGLGG